MMLLLSKMLLDILELAWQHEALAHEALTRHSGLVSAAVWCSPPLVEHHGIVALQHRWVASGRSWVCHQ